MQKVIKAIKDCVTSKTCCEETGVDCNQGRNCPVREGTHKPAEAVHQIQEPSPVQAAPAAVAAPDAWIVYAKGSSRYWTVTLKLDDVAEIYKGGEVVPLYRAALAATPADHVADAGKMVLPEPDAAISEVMELVKDWSERDFFAAEAGLDAFSEDATTKDVEEKKRLDADADAAYRAIETKLRALLATATGLPAQEVEYRKVERRIVMKPLGPCASAEVTIKWEGNAASPEITMKHWHIDGHGTKLAGNPDAAIHAACNLLLDELERSKTQHVFAIAAAKGED